MQELDPLVFIEANWTSGFDFGSADDWSEVKQKKRDQLSMEKIMRRPQTYK